jgi:hypothetical protein
MNEFTLRGRSFIYEDHPYNATRVNERAVEVPVGIYLADRAYGSSKSVLEVGAVLPHYLAQWKHDCIDKDEKYPGVLNKNVLTWENKKKYSLILSISTLDHLASAEDVLQAVANMKFWLKRDGLLLITLPYGQPKSVGGGPWLDSLVNEDALDMTEVWRMDKTDRKGHLWTEVFSGAPGLLAYNGNTPYANTVFFLLYGAVDKWWGEGD